MRCNNEKHLTRRRHRVFYSHLTHLKSLQEQKKEMYEKKTINRPLFLVKLNPELSSQTLEEAKEILAAQKKASVVSLGQQGFGTNNDAIVPKSCKQIFPKPRLKKGIDFAQCGMKRFTLCTLAWVRFLKDINFQQESMFI